MPELLRRSTDGGGTRKRRQKKYYVFILLLSTTIFWFTSLIRVSNQMPTGEASYQLSDLDVYDIDESDFVESNNNGGTSSSYDVNEDDYDEDDEDWRLSVEEKAEGKPYLRDFVFDEDDLFISQENHKRIREKDAFSSENVVNRVLPEQSPRIRHKSCALVGNSGILKRTQFGKSIDKHEAVMRVNQAPVKGYEKYVGSKITYRMLNNKWTTVYYEDGVSNTDVPGGTSNLARYLLAQEPSNVTFIVSRATTKQFETFSQTVAKRRSDMRKPLLLSSRVVSGARTALIGFRDFEKNRAMYSEEELTPSSGLLGVFLLLNLCKKVSVYGFSLDDSRKTNDMKAEGLRYHYFKKYADSERLLAHPHHNFKMEGDVLKALVDANVVTLCTKEKDSAESTC
tara:strand:- start:1687 stop:2877 length:1191 start_codon:yes stop_codon:yes gene_type:complete